MEEKSATTNGDDTALFAREARPDATEAGSRNRLRKLIEILIVQELERGLLLLFDGTGGRHDPMRATT